MVKTWSITREDVDIGSQQHEPDLTSLQGSEIPPIHFTFCMQMSMQTRLPKCKSTQVNSCFKLFNALPLQEAYKGPPWARLCFLSSTPLLSRAITQVVPCPCNSPVSVSSDCLLILQTTVYRKPFLVSLPLFSKTVSGALPKADWTSLNRSTASRLKVPGHVPVSY